MSQKNRSIKQQQKDKRQQHASAQSKTQSNSRLKLWLGLIVAATAFLLYANTLHHKYALDDYSLILENSMTKKGTSALGEIFKTGYRSGYYNSDYQLYRPLSKAMFAIEWQIAPDKPALSHWINVVLFSVSCFLLFHVLALFFSGFTGPPLMEKGGALLAAFLASILFAAHPIHTEVVANIKGRDEILSFLFVLLSIWCVYKYIKENSVFSLVLAVVFFFISLLSKESGITFLAVIPLMIYFFTNSSLAKNIRVTLALCAGTAVFLLIRRKVLGDVETATPMIDNYLFGIKDFVSQRATAILLMGVYLKLLIIPHPLISDGSYHQFPTVTVTDWHFLVSFTVYAAMIVYAIMKFKKKDIFSFSIILFLVTASIASNVIFLIGTNYGERLMFVPSLGFCIALAVLIGMRLKPQAGNPQPQTSNLKPQTPKLQLFFQTNSKAIGITAVIVLLYSAKTISRNDDWYDNLSLYSKDVVTAPNSARNHFYLGNHLTQDDVMDTIKNPAEKEKIKKQGISELNKAIELYGSYADAYHKLAKIYMEDKDYKRSEPLYQKALELSPGSPTYLNNYGTLLFNTGRLDAAKLSFEAAVKYNPYYAHAFNNLASVYGTLGQNYQMQAAQSAKNQDRQAADKNNELARENFTSAVSYFQQAIKVDPAFAQPYYLVSITYKSLGDEQNAKYYLDLYNKMTKKSS